MHNVEEWVNSQTMLSSAAREEDPESSIAGRHFRTSNCALWNTSQKFCGGFYPDWPCAGTQETYIDLQAGRIVPSRNARSILRLGS